MFVFVKSKPPLYSYMDELSDLEDILDEVQPTFESTPKPLIEDADYMELVNTCIEWMYEYIQENPCAISEPDFEEEMTEEIQDALKTLFSPLCLREEQIEEIFWDACELFYMQFIPPRSYPSTFAKGLSLREIEKRQKTIAWLRSIPQPEQRTSEWYKFRHNLITASNAYKAFENETTRNQLIFEKCQPLPIHGDHEDLQEKTSQINIESPFHWGQKYEPVSVMFYEKMFCTTVGDFGCIQHPRFPFLGASPDGINVDPENARYGRLLEIKNIVNREIDGIPKKEYWIQMQLQMETCNLDECDFLECRFVEYENEAAFFQDGTFAFAEKEECPKGVIMYFANKDGNPKYIYMPLSISTKEEYEKWEETMMDTYSKEYTWIRNIYWRLDEYSCVLVLRNKTWFQENIGKLKETWEIIEKERETGFQHRAATKRIKKNVELSSHGNSNDKNAADKCFLSWMKSKNVTATNGPIIKIRTESFDESKKNTTI